MHFFYRAVNDGGTVRSVGPPLSEEIWGVTAAGLTEGDNNSSGKNKSLSFFVPIQTANQPPNKKGHQLHVVWHQHTGSRPAFEADPNPGSDGNSFVMWLLCFLAQWATEEGTLSCFLHWNGIQANALSWFLHWTDILQGTSSRFTLWKGP